MTKFDQNQVARLNARLVVPMAIGDILSYHLDIEEEIQYGLHEALSEVDPDSALLIIALSAGQIARLMAQHMPIAGALAVEAEKIVYEYGPEWLANDNQGPVDEEALMALLKNIPEDLESLADLLDTLQHQMNQPDDPVSVLCDILSIQARAHMEIADYMLKEIENISDEGDIAESAQFPGDNIILFPVHLRQ